MPSEIFIERCRVPSVGMEINVIKLATLQNRLIPQGVEILVCERNPDTNVTGAPDKTRVGLIVKLRDELPMSFLA